MVTVLLAKLLVTPAGKPVTVAPVALAIEYVILVIAVCIHTVWLLVPGAELKVMVALTGFTVIVPLAVTTPPQLTR
jgi:hypothetical protein